MTPLSSCIVYYFVLFCKLQRRLKIMKGGWLYFILLPDGFENDTCLGSFVSTRLIFLSSSYVPLLVIASRIFCSVSSYSTYFSIRQSHFIPSVGIMKLRMRDSWVPSWPAHVPLHAYTSLLSLSPSAGRSSPEYTLRTPGNLFFIN
jgi:hypothetical protein